MPTTTSDDRDHGYTPIKFRTPPHRWIEAKATVITPHGPSACIEASIAHGGRAPLVARFGSIPLKRQKRWS